MFYFFKWPRTSVLEENVIYVTPFENVYRNIPIEEEKYEGLKCENNSSLKKI